MSVSIMQRGVLGGLLSLLVWAFPLPAEEPAPKVSLYDTKTSSAVPLPSQTLARKTGWLKLDEDTTDHRFTGDAIVMNNRLALVLRRDGPGAEIYARGDKGPTMQATLSPGGPDGRLAGIRILENTSSQVAVEASFRTPDGHSLALRYELALGQSFVSTESRPGTTELSIAAGCRFAVLPDFFADDIVIDAAEIPVSTAELPSENFLLHMIPGGRSIVMTVAGSRDYDARADLSGEKSRRMIDRTRLRYGKDRKIWVAVLEGPGIWHQREIARAELNKRIDLDWTWPFVAQWRVDWRLPRQMTGSWEMIVEQASGEFEKYGWFGPSRTFAADVLSKQRPPCWVDRGGRGHFQAVSYHDLRGPALLYPINRVGKTPLGQLTVVDLVRATLGVGPCEYVLDVEGQHATMRGRATCGNRGVLNEIYAAGKQKAKRAEIERSLIEVVVFVKDIRQRIEQYVAFGHAIRTYLEQQKTARPELAPFLDDMQKQIASIDEAFDRRRSKIQTPQHVVDLTDQFRRTLIDYEGPDALEKCKAINEAIVVVGGNQDSLVCQCRQAVKILRQRAGLAMATDPRTAEIAKELRRRTQEILRNPVSYEHPRP